MLSKQNHGSVKAEVSFRINKKQVTVAVFKTKKWPNQKNTNALVIASSYQVLTFFFFFQVLTFYQERMNQKMQFT